VPMIVKLPAAQSAGRAVEAQVRTTDLMPTALELAHAELPTTLDGQSLKSYFASGQGGDRTAYGETDYPLRFGWAPLRSVRADHFKLIEAPKSELYDLRTDPGELKNAFAPDNGTVKKLSEMLATLGPTPDTVAGTGALPDPKDKIDEQNLLHTAMLASDD